MKKIVIEYIKSLYKLSCENYNHHDWFWHIMKYLGDRNIIFYKYNNNNNLDYEWDIILFDEHPSCKKQNSYYHIKIL